MGAGAVEQGACLIQRALPDLNPGQPERQVAVLGMKISSSGDRAQGPEIVAVIEVGACQQEAQALRRGIALDLRLEQRDGLRTLATGHQRASLSFSLPAWDFLRVGR